MSGDPGPGEGAEPRRWIADRSRGEAERSRRDAERPRRDERPRKDERSRKDAERPRKDAERSRRDERPRREVVTSPRTMAPRHPRYPVTREIDEQTRLGEVYMRSLVRTQFRLALFVCTVLGCVVAGLPLMFLLVPELRAVHVLGIPLPWAVLGGLIYPAFVIGAWLYVRQAERNERHFAELVDRAP
ncbi:hypothetical protein [Streptosporangium sp. NBC_01469]|uniref:hypothetical protein n=1 Tax=Streptosporangium sp. NBC_01469 TaxID=2903898 RepID=UPI002E28C5FC|nr:hypothetical protein [Streptosporangium sp. NBC_01469]